jgi:mevalonate kinase
MNIFSDFQTQTYGKWILCGEHAVLRGHPAIIFPLFSKKLVLQYLANSKKLTATFSGDYSAEMQLLFWGAWKQALSLLKIQANDIHGTFHFENNIPVGTGMGSSAALCVALGRFFVAQGLIGQENLLEFSREIENLFHNQSSGVDIAVSIAEKGIIYSIKEGITPLNQAWNPQWYLSFSGTISPTSRCVKKVKQLFNKDPVIAETLDRQMAHSVALALEAIQNAQSTALKTLTQAINLAAQCFKEWGLINASMEQHIKKLEDHGALAVKSTGSGNGGFVLSLWKDEIPVFPDIDLIKL